MPLWWSGARYQPRESLSEVSIQILTVATKGSGGGGGPMTNQIDCLVGLDVTGVCSFLISVSFLLCVGVRMAW